MTQIINVRTATTRPIYTDYGTGARLNVAIFEPDVPEGWYFLGHVAVQMEASYKVDDPILQTMAPQAVIVQPASDSTVICAVDPGALLWTDAHSGGDQDVELYALTPAGDSNDKDLRYSSLGLFASVVKRYGTDPTANPMFAKLCAIRADLLISGPLGNLVWNDQGSGANGRGAWKDVSLWSFGVNKRGYSPLSGFVATQGYANPPQTTSTPAAVQLDLSRVNLDGKHLSWMSTSTIQRRKLKEICLPATHDSGAYWLSDTMTSKPSGVLAFILSSLQSVVKKLEAIPGIGTIMPDPFAWVLEQVVPTIQKLSTTTRRTIFSQLCSGIRCLDLRLYFNGTDFYVFHGFQGERFQDVLDQIALFLSITKSEVVYITIGHFAGFDSDSYARLATAILDTLGPYAYCRTVENGKTTNDPFQQTIADITSQKIKTQTPGSRAILVYNPLDASTSNDDVAFWPSCYSPPDNNASNTQAIYGFYTSTTSPDEMVDTQLAQQQKASQLGLPFALYWTLTPSSGDSIKRTLYSLAGPIAKFAAPLLLNPSNPVGVVIGTALETLAAGLKVANTVTSWHTLHDLTKTINPQLVDVLTTKFDAPGVNLLYLDYFEDTKVVDLIVAMSSRRRLHAFADAAGQHVLYVSSDGHVHQLYESSSFQDEDLTAQTKGPIVPPGAPLFGYAGTDGNEHVCYVATDNHVHQLLFTGSWQDQDLTALAKGPDARPDSAITSYMDAGGKQVVFYIAADGHVHELLWNGTSWSDSSPGGPSVSEGSGLSAFIDGNGQHVFLIGANSHVHQLYWNGAWQDQDLTALASGPAALSNAPIASYSDGSGNEHVYHIAADGKVHELLWNGTSWSASSPGGPAACADSGLSAFSDGSGHHVFLIGADNHVHQLYSNGAWQDQDLTAQTQGRSAVPGPGIAAYGRGAGEERAFFLGSDSNVYELSWSGGPWQQRWIAQTQ